MKLKKAGSLALVLSLILVLALPLGAPVYASSVPGSYIFDISEGNITVSAGSGAETLNVTYGATPATTADFSSMQSITIIGSSATYTVAVSLGSSSNQANITLDNVDIEIITGDLCAFSIASGTVNLTLAGTNILKSSGGNAGLRVEGANALTIQGEGSLTATGASSAAGIGGGNSSASGSITINSGTITAIGRSSGIGAGADANSGTVTINGGMVTATGTSGPGVGGGTFCATGDIAITGGTVLATGAIGAGIGSRNFGSVGRITISGGTVTAIGSAAGIGAGTYSTPGVVAISEAAKVTAVSGSGTAIEAVDGSLEAGCTAYVLMANYSTSQSSGTAAEIYLKSDASLKAGYTPGIQYISIAFTLPAAATYQLKAADVLQQHGSGGDTDFVVASAGLTVFDSVAEAPVYTVTVKKDGTAWTSETPDMELSTANDSLAGAVTGACTDGVYTYIDFDQSLTYYVWDTTNSQFTGQSVSAEGMSATVDYHTVTLAKGTGIDSVSGEGAYLSGDDISIDATVSDGYIWYKWIKTDDRTLVSDTRNYTITNISEAQSFTAKAYSTREEGIAWTDAGNYDETLYEALIDSEFSETSVEISTARQLAAVARAQDIDGIDFSGVTFALTDDIDLSAYLWDPIGLGQDDMLYGKADGNEHPFLGNFDGNGHVISNMTIDGSYISAGLFGNVGIPNLDEYDPDVVRITIKNVTVEGIIAVTDAIYVGGIVGSGGNLILENCVNRTSITGTGDAIFGGGVLGFGMFVVLDNCVNESGADIYVAATSTKADEMAAGTGGIVGAAFLGSIYDSANFASITASSAGEQPLTGGILGIGLSGTIGNCYNTGAVTAEGSNSMAGGICGFEMDIFETDDPYIKDCYNTGSVTAITSAGIAASVNGVDNCFYLIGTADYAYFDENNHSEVGAALSDTDMQADAFCQTLNDWVAENPVSSSFLETSFNLPGIEFQGWVQREGVNNGYPIFENDAREATHALTLNLNGGNGSSTGGSYASGAAVSIDAGTKNGYSFGIWMSSDGGAFDNSGNASTTFTMPANATTVTATWTKNNSDDISPEKNTTIIIGGIDYAIGHEVRNGSSTTATVDGNRLKVGISGASDGAGVLFPVSANGSVEARLVLQNIRDMAQKDMTLTIQTGNISYHLNATAIDTEAIMEALGTADADSITFSVGIRNSSAVVNGATVVVAPVEFTITCAYNGQTVIVDTFRSFVIRSVEVTVEQAAQITTAVVVETDGTLRQVPTKVITQSDSNGTLHYYAVFSSLTNSTYALIQYAGEFSDVAASWAVDAIGDMGARRIVSGLGDNNYEPGRNITRAEFAAIIVKALGLKPGLGESKFNDVDPACWYCGYIETAVSYGLIKGYGDGTFGPSDDITREQAMVVVALAMKLTKISPNLTQEQMADLAGSFLDSSEASGWASQGIADCLETGMIKGRTSTNLCPKENITRAEVAVIMQRLLQKSGLTEE